MGLSATQHPLEEIARVLRGQEREKEPARDLEDEAPLRPRRVTVVDAGVRKLLEIEVVIPVDDMAELGTVVDEPMSGPAAAWTVRRSLWPAMTPRLLALVSEARSHMIFLKPLPVRPDVP